ncbi:hypothetical protein F5Y15DRAFT_407601 [Xylariaceae sp. FL0016]|nr:hypothetical protein F5Y15DRAFT_407601 [Xylariaceae sp. FL0016]
METAVDDAIQSRRLVRSEAQVLGQALGRNSHDPRDIANPWRRFFDAWEPTEEDQNPLTDMVAIEAAELRKRCLGFLHSCSGEDQLDLSRSEPTLESVVDLVKRVSATSQTKKHSSRLGKAMQRFHKFCGTVNAHKTMLELIPQGSEYVSVLAGTLNVIIQASANHERIAEGLSEALCTISEHIVECKTEMEIFHTKDMMRLVADVYSQIFLFLSDVMDWVTEKRRKRLLDSFNDNLVQKFENRIVMIKSKSDLIRNLAAQSSRAEQRATRLIVEDMARNVNDLRIGAVGQERRYAHMVYFAGKIESELAERQKEREMWKPDGPHFKQLAGRVTMMLEDNLKVWCGDKRSGDGITEPSLSSIGARPCATWTSDEILSSSKHLEDYFHRDRLRLAGDPVTPATVPKPTLTQLSEWMRDDSARIIWLDGPSMYLDDIENPITMLATKVTELAEQTGIPVLSYCCELRRGERTRAGNDTREAQASVSLLSALLRQMMELLLPRFETDFNLSSNRFQFLDGTVLCWSEMIHLLHDLLRLMPETLLCVISGFHWLDDRSTAGILEELLQTMRGSKMRVLFATTGRSSCLRKHLRIEETLVIEKVDMRKTCWGLERSDSWARYCLSYHHEK